MKDWLAEIFDQLSLGKFLSESSISCGARFGLIAIDNAIEFMLVAYVETYRQLVGGHKTGGIAKNLWTQTKEKFPELLNYVVMQEPKLQPFQTDIDRFHKVRNDLYHTGNPLTVSSRFVDTYYEKAKKVFSILFSAPLSSSEWENGIGNIADTIVNGTASPKLKRTVSYETFDGVVLFKTNSLLTASEAIALILHGYSILTGAAPSRPSLIQSLARSGHPLTPDVVKARITDLRKKRWLQKNELILSSRGRDELSKKFLL